jgi:hypothetical protein
MNKSFPCGKCEFFKYRGNQYQCLDSRFYVEHNGNPTTIEDNVSELFEHCELMNKSRMYKVPKEMIPKNIQYSVIHDRIYPTSLTNREQKLILDALIQMYEPLMEEYGEDSMEAQEVWNLYQKVGKEFLGV